MNLAGNSLSLSGLRPDIVDQTEILGRVARTGRQKRGDRHTHQTWQNTHRSAPEKR